MTAGNYGTVQGMNYPTIEDAIGRTPLVALQRIGSGLTSQIGMVGPVSTVMMGVVILGEPFTAWTAAGSALVIAGVALLSRTR